MKFKKTTLLFGAFASVITPMTAVISCGKKEEVKNSSKTSFKLLNESKNKDYSFGISYKKLNNLNYLVNDDASKISSSFVEGLLKASPWKQTTSMQQPTIADATSGEWFGNTYQTGTLRRTLGLVGGVGNKYNASFWNDKNTSTFTANLDENNVWSNGDKLTSSNFIDAIVYMLDLNYVSEARANQIANTFKFTHSKEFVDAQIEYKQLTGKYFANPFGYVKHHLPQNASEEVKKAWSYYIQSEMLFDTKISEAGGSATPKGTIIAKIKAAATQLGIFGDKYSSHPSKTANFEDDVDKQVIIEGKEYVPTVATATPPVVIHGGGPGRRKRFAAPPVLKPAVSVNNNPVVNHNPLAKAMSPFILEMKTDTSSPFSGQDNNEYFIKNVLAKNSHLLTPVNKSFVEKVGFHNFGTSKDTILSEGSFNLSSVEFKDNGGIHLSKNDSYYRKSEIVPSNVYVNFTSDLKEQFKLFQQKRLAKMDADPSILSQVLSDPDSAKYLSKVQGMGADVLKFNLRNGNQQLRNDKHLRRALMFATDRAKIMQASRDYRFSYLEYSLLDDNTPVHSWIGGGPNRPDINNPGYSAIAGNTYASEEAQYSDTTKTHLIGSDLLKTLGASQVYSQPRLNDEMHNLVDARKEIADFKTANPSINKIMLRMLSDGSKAGERIANEYKRQINEAFGGFVEIRIDTYSDKSQFNLNVYNGQYDIMFTSASDILSDHPEMSGLQRFMYNRNNGDDSLAFVEIKALMDSYASETAAAQARLGIDPKDWAKLAEIMTPDTSRPSQFQAWIQKVYNFFTNPIANTKADGTHDKDYDTFEEVMKLVIAGHKILIDQAVVIPLFKHGVTLTLQVAEPWVIDKTFSSGGFTPSYIRID